jgi:cell division septation protein DedD
MSTVIVGNKQLGKQFNRLVWQERRLGNLLILGICTLSWAIFINVDNSRLNNTPISPSVLVEAVVPPMQMVVQVVKATEAATPVIPEIEIPAVKALASRQPDPQSLQATTNSLVPTVPLPGKSATTTTAVQPIEVKNEGVATDFMQITTRTVTEDFPVVGSGRYLVLAGSYFTQDEANARFDKLVVAGAATHMQRVRTDGRAIFHIKVGPFSNSEQAAKAVEFIVKKTKIPVRYIHSRYNWCVTVSDGDPEIRKIWVCQN